jgi:3-hydroxyisobutyrate dehydrogenase-like beta-hydroxyacid dehydrogenase
MAEPLERVGFLGIGKLGGPVLACILDAEWAVTAYDPRPEALAPFGARLTAVGSAAEVAAASDVVQLLVNDDDQVMGALLGPDGVLAGAAPGLIVLVHSTISHTTLRTVAAEAAAQGVHLLDAPLSGAMGQHSLPNLCAMVGGDRESLDRVRPLLGAFASLILHLGELGAGLDAKVARNAIGYIWYTACNEGLRLATGCGIPVEVMLQIMEHTGLHGYIGGLGSVPTDVNQEELPRQAQGQGGQHIAQVAKKDLRAALARADEVGVAMPLTLADVDAIDNVFPSND